MVCTGIRSLPTPLREWEETRWTLHENETRWTIDPNDENTINAKQQTTESSSLPEQGVGR